MADSLDYGNRVDEAREYLLLHYPTERALIDCGCGQRYSDRDREGWADHVAEGLVDILLFD